MSTFKKVIAVAIVAAIGFVAVAQAFAAGTVVSAQTKSTKITLEAARKLALKRVEGTVDDEFPVEDVNGKVVEYIFYIKTKDKKFWSVQIDAEKGEILSVEEQEPDETQE